MKELMTPYQAMEEFVKYVHRAYLIKKEKTEGSIQFHFTHSSETIDCYLKVDLSSVRLFAGIIANPTVVLKSSFYHWLDVAAKRLNPIIGVMTGKLKFKGDTSFFSKVISENMFDVDISQYIDPVTDFEKNPHKQWKTPKKIFVINSSPQANRGYTEFYLKAFLKGLKKQRLK